MPQTRQLMPWCGFGEAIAIGTILAVGLYLMEANVRRKAIIVVEDDETIAELVKDTLNAELAYQAVSVGDGALALDVIQSVKASLIILDLDLPGLDGLDIYDRLQQDERTKVVPTLFLTARPEHPGLKDRNIQHVLGKPFDLSELLDAVAEACGP